MITTINNYVDGDYNVTEYGNGAVVRSLISQPIPEPPQNDPQPSTDEIIRANYLETQYQTALLEMQSGM